MQRGDERRSTLTQLRQDGSTWGRFGPKSFLFENLSRSRRRPSRTIYGMTAFRRTVSLNDRDRLTLFSHQELGRPSRQTHERSAFHQLRERSLQDCLAGACATYPLHSHELRQNRVNIDAAHIHGHYAEKITMTPVTLRIEVAEIQARLLPKADVRDSPGNFSRHEGPSTTGALVVEENAIASVHVVGLAIVFGDPESIKLCDTVRAARVERGILVLRDGLNQSVKLGSRGLVEPHVALKATCAYGIEQA